MKMKSHTMAMTLSFALAALMLSGCAQQRHARYHGLPKPTAGTGNEGYGPTFTTFEEGGVLWKRGSMSFPTGVRATSALMVEKTVPAEVLAGQKFDYAYKVINLTDHPIQAVTVLDRVPVNFTPAESDPPAVGVNEGIASWQIGNLGAKETRVIHVKGVAIDEGAISTCGWATFNPVLCEDIRVVKASLQLQLSAPPEVTICDPIPVTLTVKNTGSAPLTQVRLNQNLPQGLTSDGRSIVSFDAGNMAPGESKEFKFIANPSTKGAYAHTAQATSAQNVVANAAGNTVVHEPILTITGNVQPEQQYMGRPFDVCFTVASKGDSPAGGAVLQLPIPPGLSFKSATEGGAVTGDSVVWDLGPMAPDTEKHVCSTFTSPGGGIVHFTGTAKGTCAKPVSADGQIAISGVAGLLLEKADDPDPISVGETTTFTVKVTNQGTADDTNVKMVVEFPDELTPLSASHGGVIEGKRVTFPPYPRLGAKQAFSYTIQTKGEKVGDARVRFIRTSDSIPAPTTSEESTRIY